jgi:hypothetical protein
VGANFEPIWMKFDMDVVMLKVMLNTPKWRTFKLLGWVHLWNRLVDFDEILYGGDAIEGDLNAIFSNPVPSTIPEWRAFKFLRWLQRNPLITFELIGGFS